MQIETEKGVDRASTLSGFQNDARPLDLALKIHVVETLARAEKRKISKIQREGQGLLDKGK